MEGDKYRQDGVNIEEGDDFSAAAAKVCQSTYGNSPFVKITDMSRGNFRGPRGFDIQNLRGAIQTIAPDGIGTKVVIIDAAQTYGMAARDVFAMTASDITRWGGMPLIFASVLDVASLGQKGDPINRAARQVIMGAHQAANEIKVVMLTGETAELGFCVSSENPQANLKFNWAGFMVGVYHPDKIILGDNLAPGQIIMALKENGFRSNGISSVRKALKIKYGANWWANPEAKQDIIACAEPSVLYDRFICHLNGWIGSYPTIEMHLIVHLSGGAFESKFANDLLFPMKLSARIDNLFEPPAIMKKCAEWRGMSEEECYSTWNGGQGMIVVIDPEDEKNFIGLAKGFDLVAQRCGVIVKNDKPSVIIESRFGSGKTIIYKPKAR